MGAVIWGSKGKGGRKLGFEVKQREKGREDPLFKDLQRRGAFLCGLGSWL